MLPDPDGFAIGPNRPPNNGGFAVSRAEYLPTEPDEFAPGIADDPVMPDAPDPLTPPQPAEPDPDPGPSDPADPTTTA
jgi:hypothetical protein